MIKKFISYYRPHLGLFILDMVCAFLISASDLVLPMVTRNILNDVIPDKDLQLLLKLSLLLLVMYIVRLILDYIVGYYGHMVGVMMEYDMRQDIFEHIQTLPLSFFDNVKTGNIMSRIVNDLNEISELAHHGPEDFFISIIMILGSFILLLTINVKLTLITFSVLPVMFYFAFYYNDKLEKAFAKYRISLANINSNLEDSLSGIRVVKSFTNEKYEIKKFGEGNNIFKNTRTDAVKYIGIFDSVVNFFCNIAYLAPLTAGGYFVFKGLINVGDLVAYIMYVSLFLKPLDRLMRFTELFQSGAAGFRRFIEIMETKSDIVDRPGSINLTDVMGNIKFNNVKFSYDEKNTVLSNINLDVASGETVAIVGPSGAGKTTLCSIIPRFYDIDDGKIEIDGKDIRDVTLLSLRKNIGIVQQDVFLFAGTIRENIRYGKLDAGNEEIETAAKLANAHEFIMELPDGYDTYIGERGVKLSGGQKQRISIARMFLKNPPILILDEATSSLDNQSEAVIQSSIEKLAKNRTTFIIAHRLATIKNAKRIIVLTDRGIEEEGTHNELINKKGVYYSLYNSQFKLSEENQIIK